MGIRGHLAQYITKFLENRIFKVKLGSSFSDWQTQEEGVPQGSILSVTLFIIKIKAISHTLVNFWTCNFNHFFMLIVNFKCCLVGRKKKKWGSPCSFSFHRASNMTCFFPIIMNYIRNVTKNSSKYF